METKTVSEVENMDQDQAIYFSQDRLRQAILDALEENNIPPPANLAVDVHPGRMEAELTFFDRPNVSLCSRDDTPEQFARDLVTLACRNYSR